MRIAESNIGTSLCPITPVNLYSVIMLIFLVEAAGEEPVAMSTAFGADLLQCIRQKMKTKNDLSEKSEKQPKK